MSNPTVITADEFATEVENHTGVTLVDFYADWCGPCKMIAPLLEVVADEFEDELKVVKVDADQSSELLAKYGVRGLPTLMLFKDGVPVATKTGAVPLKELRSFVS